MGQQLKQQVDKGDTVTDHWTNVKPVNGPQYRALWVDGADLKENPFQLVRDQVTAEHGGGKAGEEYALRHMGQHSIAVVGETDAKGRPGFVNIDGRFGRDPSLRNGPHDSGAAEEWLFGHGNAPLPS